MTHELPNGFVKDVVGYCDPLSIRPGEQIYFKLSSHRPGSAALEIVQLISGDDRPHGTGLIERLIDSPGLPPSVELIHQPLVQGSYAHVADLPCLDSGTISLAFYPTLLSGYHETLAQLANLRISVDAQGLSLRSNTQELRLNAPMQLRRWYQLEVSFGSGAELSLLRFAAGVSETSQSWRVSDALEWRMTAGDWYLACSHPGDGHFNGRLEGLEVNDATGLVLKWDFSKQIQTQTVVDTSGHNRHGQLYQTPTRGVRGRLWNGSEQNYQRAPEQYAAIHFHADDLTDARWQDTLQWTIPNGLASGQYALKVTQGASEDYIPFFVRSKPGERGADLVYLVPTASYLAYANQRVAFAEGIFGNPVLRHANDAYLYVHKAVGYSLYEYHQDHSGVHFSSRLRPVLNLKPRTGTWAFNADTHLTAWLDAIDQPFDVLTDEDLHLEGANALTGYRTVITGTHPEYYSTAMRDGLAQWLGRGGRLMYMGGNGFYWRIAYQPDNPGVIEVRRAEDGTRAWIAEPGEYYQQFNGEYGGLWRRLGKPPNELVGIGFAAQGFDGGTYYRVASGALDPRVSFITEGIHADEFWGQFGNQGGGAAGEEIDRYDEALGSPAHAVIIASSENHRSGMLRVKEEFHMMEPLGNDPKVRADMVFFEVPGGGAVFSTGSISYAGSLAHNDYDNEIAQITGNVLRRFLDATPFVYPSTPWSTSD